MPSPPRLSNNALQLVDLPLRAAERAKLQPQRLAIVSSEACLHNSYPALCHRFPPPAQNGSKRRSSQAATGVLWTRAVTYPLLRQLPRALVLAVT